jgi:hypothetical protein
MLLNLTNLVVYMLPYDLKETCYLVGVYERDNY